MFGLLFLLKHGLEVIKTMQEDQPSVSHHLPSLHQLTEFSSCVEKMYSGRKCTLAYEPCDDEACNTHKFSRQECRKINPKTHKIPVRYGCLMANVRSRLGADSILNIKGFKSTTEMEQYSSDWDMFPQVGCQGVF